MFWIDTTVSILHSFPFVKCSSILCSQFKIIFQKINVCEMSVRQIGRNLFLFFFSVYRKFCPTLRKTAKKWFYQLPSCTYKHSTKWFMIIENIIIEKSTKVIITMNNVKIIVTCDFSSDGLHFILYFHSWFMWRYNKTTVGNLSKENCSVDGWFGNSIHTNSRLDMFKFMRTFEEKHSIVWQKHESI